MRVAFGSDLAGLALRELRDIRETVTIAQSAGPDREPTHDPEGTS
jgi:hypothetical protein